MIEQDIDIFLICPVRSIHGRVKKAIERYVKEKEDNGLIVYWPQRDTNQTDVTGGIRICRDNTTAIIRAKEIHVWWNELSVGSKFDMGSTLTSMILLAELEGIEKKVIIANPRNVNKNEGKSFENVLLALEEISGEGFLEKLYDLE